MVASSSKVCYCHYRGSRDRFADHVEFDVGLKEGAVQFAYGNGHLCVCPSGQRSCTTDLKRPEGEESGVLLAGENLI